MSETDSKARNAGQIEADLSRNRSRMDDMLDRLQERLSPDELVDQALRYVRRGGGGSSSSLKEVVVRNPLPVTLVSVGMAWLLMAGRAGSVPHEQRSRWSDDGRPAADDDNTDAQTAADDADWPPRRQPAVGAAGPVVAHANADDESRGGAKPRAATHAEHGSAATAGRDPNRVSREFDRVSNSIKDDRHGQQ